MEEHKLRVGTLFVPARFDSEPAWAKYCLPTLRDCVPIGSSMQPETAFTVPVDK